MTKRKLIEVALPIAAISEACRADKNRKVGTLRNLHKWFAPMPTPAWRALLFAAVIDAPDDDAGLQDLLTFVKDLVPASGDEPSVEVMDRARKMVAESNQGMITVLDPFAGGGSTLVEAQRLGMSAMGSDLNPVAALISRFLVQLAPIIRDADSLLDTPDLAIGGDPYAAFRSDVAQFAADVRLRAQARLNDAYPDTGCGQAIAWIWAHSVPCPNPACAVEVPLLSSTDLSKQPGRRAWLHISYEGRQPLFTVKTTEAEASAATKLAGRRAEFGCPLCATRFDDEYIKIVGKRAPLSSVPVASVYDISGRRTFFGSRDRRDDFRAANVPRPPIDVAELPAAALGFRVQAYGFSSYADLYTNRQQLALSVFAECIAKRYEEAVAARGDSDYLKAVVTFLGLSLGRLAQTNSKQVSWFTRNGPSKAKPAFSQQVVSMLWDYCETNPFGGSVGDWDQVVRSSLTALPRLPHKALPGRVALNDARKAAQEHLPSPVLVATDPPYFDAIGYSDLSDYFYLWHRLALSAVWPDLYLTASAPRTGELIADRDRHGGDSAAAASYFIDGFSKIFSALSHAAADLPMLVVYAHQQREVAYGEAGHTGWEAMLQSLLTAEIAITGSWPIRGTSEFRVRGLQSNALASYVVLVCRPAPVERIPIDRRGFISALKAELPDAVRLLQAASIAPLDLPQAAIGPGMSIFTRYRAVVESDGSTMSVRTVLGLINQALDEVLSEQEGDFESETRFCVKWFTEYQWEEAESGVADGLARGTNTSIAALERGGVFRARAGRARLLVPVELVDDWDPSHNEQLSIWQVVVGLAQVLETTGGEEAARLMSVASQRIDLDTAKELAYLLFSICNRRGWTQSALLFNGLGTSWSDLFSVSRGAGMRTAPEDQGALDFAYEEA